jgi:hypothetical protein
MESELEDRPDPRYAPGRTIPVQVDASILQKFQGENRHKLLHYLANSAIWRVTCDDYERETSRKGMWRNKIVANLRLTPSFFSADREHYRQKAVSEFDKVPATICTMIASPANAGPPGRPLNFNELSRVVPGMPDNWTIRVRLLLKGDKDPSDINAASEAKKPILMKMSTFTGPGAVTDSALIIPGEEISIFIDESSTEPDIVDPFLTKKCLAFVLDELKDVATAIDASKDMSDESILPKGAVQKKSRVSFDPGWKIVKGFTNPGKEGLLTLNCDAKAPWGFLGPAAGGSTQTTMCGWSDDPNQEFFFALPYMINTGDGPGTGFSEGDFNFRLFFTPSGGKDSSVLWPPAK